MLSANDSRVRGLTEPLWLASSGSAGRANRAAVVSTQLRKPNTSQSRRRAGVARLGQVSRPNLAPLASVVSPLRKMLIAASVVRKHELQIKSQRGSVA